MVDGIGFALLHDMIRKLIDNIMNIFDTWLEKETIRRYAFEASDHFRRGWEFTG
jgi:hypothetical protein